MASRVAGDVAIDLGQGLDRLVLLASRFDSEFSADGGPGEDRVFKPLNRFRGGQPTFDNFE